MSLRKWLGLCIHKWKKIDTIDVYNVNYPKHENYSPTHYEYIMQCEHCGWIKKKRI